MSNEEWCFSWFAKPPRTKNIPRAVSMKASCWTPGETIRISFLDGHNALQDAVREIALRWIQADTADLRFEFRNDPTNAEIRISFQYAGNWSMIGTTCRSETRTDVPTMNYGALSPNDPDEKIRRAVLHEFGHALSLVHEHQNPSGTIRWNKPTVIQALIGPPNNWTQTQIHENVFKAHKAQETNFTQTDVNSIMVYPIPASWTHNTFVTQLNTELSQTDIDFIHNLYR